MDIQRADRLRALWRENCHGWKREYGQSFTVRDELEAERMRIPVYEPNVDVCSITLRTVTFHAKRGRSRSNAVHRWIEAEGQIIQEYFR